MKPGTSRVIGIGVVLSMMAAALMFLGVTIDEFSHRGFEYVIVSLIGEVLLFSMLMFGPVGRAIAKMLEGGDQSPDPMTLNRLADVEDRLAEISGEVQRLTELESRLEFAERLLAAPTDNYPKGSR